MDPVHTATGHGPCERSVLAKVLAEQGVPEMSTSCLPAVYQLSTSCLPDMSSLGPQVTSFHHEKFEDFEVSVRDVSCTRNCGPGFLLDA